MIYSPEALRYFWFLLALDAKSSLSAVNSSRSSLLPLLFVFVTVGFAGELSSRLHLKEMELGGLNPTVVNDLAGSPPELVHRLAWGASVLVVLVVAAGSIVTCLWSLIQVAKTCPGFSTRGAIVVLVFLATTAISLVRWPLSGLAPATLAPFQAMLRHSPGAGVDIGRMTTTGNQLVGGTIAILVGTVTFLLVSPDRETTGQFRVRHEGLKLVVGSGVALLVCGLVEISLLHSWPAAVLMPPYQQDARSVAMVVSVVGGAFFGLLTLSVSLPTGALLRRQRLALAQRQLGGNATQIQCHEWIINEGLISQPLERRLNAISSLIPILTAAPITALVQFLAQEA